VRVVIGAPQVGAIEIETDDIEQAIALSDGGAILKMKDGNCPIATPRAVQRLWDLGLLPGAPFT